MKVKLGKIFFLFSFIFLLLSCSRGSRTGAICEDGWESHSKGQGTCSHHGGVDHWTYENDD